MPYKHQAESYRNGGEWVCWCDGYNEETTLKVVEDVRRQGFKAKREKDRVFVKAEDIGKIQSLPL